VATYVNLKHAGHTRYGLGYIVAQTCNVLALLLAWNATDRFLDGQFNTLGFHWAKAGLQGLKGRTSAYNVLYRVFPRVTKCEFQKFGAGGDLDVHDYLCVLAPNILSEKIFVFLWFWYGLLLFVGVLNLLTILLMAIKTVRIRSLFMMRAVFSGKIRQHVRSSDRLRAEIERMHFGKFLFLYLLGRNVDFYVYKRVLDAAVENVDRKLPR